MKTIKRNIYGKPQAVKATFPAGLGDVALHEVKTILATPWFPQRFLNQITLKKNEINIKNIHYSSVTELLMRSQCLTDIRLITFEGRADSKASFEKKCRSIHWDYFLNQSMAVKIKVYAPACKTFNSTTLKDILSKIISSHVNAIVAGEDSQETTTIYADFYRNKLAVSISLAGTPLYKRGYRRVLSNSAPLREDAASCCIQKSLLFAKKFNKTFSPATIIIPFSGTGTFAFEYLQYYYHFSSVLFEREYALQQMPLFGADNFNYLVKKAREHCLFPVNEVGDKLKLICIDNSKEANAALVDNIDRFKAAVHKNNFLFTPKFFLNHEDFFKWELPELISDTFILLNPPYGIRLTTNAKPVAMYKQIAVKVNKIAQIIKKHHKNLLGVILCPTEETWSSFYKNLGQAEIETYHFTQGGIDIRVCQFLFR